MNAGTLLEQAADWAARFEELTEAEQIELKQWLNADRDNFEAFREMLCLYGAEELTAALYDVKYVDAPSPKPETAGNVSNVINFHERRRNWFALGAAVVALVMVVQVPQYFNKSYAPTDVAVVPSTTLIGEVGKVSRQVVPDGSVITLSSGGMITWEVTQEQRSVELSGQAYFAVAKDPSRPFVVHAGNLDITVLGTEFDIDMTPEGTSVHVTEGVISVTLGDNSAAAREIVAGEAVFYDGNNVTLLNESYVNWKEGWLEADNTPLYQVLSTLQKYTSYAIRLSDDSLRNAPISGRFNLEQPLESLQLIAQLLNLRLEQSAQEWTLVKDE